MEHLSGKDTHGHQITSAEGHREISFEEDGRYCCKYQGSIFSNLCMAGGQVTEQKNVISEAKAFGLPPNHSFTG
jgi:hypothetical protein